MNQLDKNTLVITEVPFGTTTTSLIDTILKANEKGKIKIKKIDDNTAADVEILIRLPGGISPDKTIVGGCGCARNDWRISQSARTGDAPSVDDGPVGQGDDMYNGGSNLFRPLLRQRNVFE